VGPHSLEGPWKLRTIEGSTNLAYGNLRSVQSSCTYQSNDTRDLIRRCTMYLKRYSIFALCVLIKNVRFRFNPTGLKKSLH